MYYALDRSLPRPLDASPESISTASGEVTLWSRRDTGEGHALLLIHSVNAAASAYEVGPLFEYFAPRRPVFALELPGFGHSSKPRQPYDSEVMEDAIRRTVDRLMARGFVGVDVLALSLSCEFAARVASQRAKSIRTLCLISPTGFETKAFIRMMRKAHGFPSLRRSLDQPLWGGPVFRGMTRPSVLRAFLAKTWGSTKIDEGLLAYDALLVRQPGAQHAPFSFMAGLMFRPSPLEVYNAVEQPVLTVIGSRGDFVDHTLLKQVSGRANWTVVRLDSGAFPQFDALPSFLEAYDGFICHAAVVP